MDLASIAAAYFGGGADKGGGDRVGTRIGPVIVGTGASKIAAVLPQMGEGGSGSGMDLLPGISPDPVITGSTTNLAGLRVPTEQLYLGMALVAMVLLIRRRR